MYQINEITNKILNGDALTHLKQIPNESIDCVITSPPYWGCRSYGKETETIWDEKINCKHEFKTSERYIYRGSVVDNISVGMNKKGNYLSEWKVEDNICKKCGAFKGSLGLEPHPSLYIKHIVDIACECMRILKKSGTFFLNLGDVYYTKSGSGFKFDKLKERFLDDDLSNHANQIRGKYKTNWLQHKQKLLIPHRIAIALQEKGFIVRDDIIWIKKLNIYPNKETIGAVLPFPVKDKLLNATEYIFQINKSKKYYFNLEEVKTTIKDSSYNRMEYNESLTMKREDSPYKKQKFKKYWEKIVGKGYPNWNIGNVNVQKANPTNAILFRRINQFNSKEDEEKHFASFPESLPEFFIKIACPKDGIVLDPFMGSGTTGLVALKLNRKFIGIELSPIYVKMAYKRLKPYLEQVKLTAT